MLALDTIDVPDPGLYVAHRAWVCSFEYDRLGRLIIRSTGCADPWKSAEKEATCTTCVNEAPNEDCSCGIYGLKSPESARAYFWQSEKGWILPQ
jgi:hypothetical protein